MAIHRYSELAEWLEQEAPTGPDDEDARKRLANGIPKLLAFSSELEEKTKRDAELRRNAGVRGAFAAREAPRKGPALELLKIGPRFASLDPDKLPGANTMAAADPPPVF